MLITTGGVLIRTRVAEIRGMGRATQGVTLINLGDDEKLAGLERVVETDENGSEDTSIGPAGSGGPDSAQGSSAQDSSEELGPDQPE